MARPDKRLCETTGARCLGPCPCEMHAKAAASMRIEEMAKSRRRWRRIALGLFNAVAAIFDEVEHEP